MRLFGQPGVSWCVYHAERCEVLYCVIWVDDDTNQWAEAMMPLRVVDGELGKNVHQARKIDIITAKHLVIINPIEGTDQDEITDCIGQPMTEAAYC